MNLSSISTVIEDEAWQLTMSPEQLTRSTSLLEKTTAFISTQGITSTRNDIKLTWLVDETHLYAPELGIRLSLKNEHNYFVHKGKLHDLALTTAAENESLTLEFDAISSNANSLKVLTQSVKKVIRHNDVSNTCKTNKNACPCCIREQNNIRLNHKIHPLYWILESLVNERETVTIQHTGKHTSHSMSISPDSQLTEDGYFFLNETNKKFSIDLTEVYNVRVQIDVIESIPTTTLIGFNSFGNNLFELRHNSTEAFHHWNGLLRTTRLKSSCP